MVENWNDVSILNHNCFNKLVVVVCKKTIYIFSQWPQRHCLRRCSANSWQKRRGSATQTASSSFWIPLRPTFVPRMSRTACWRAPQKSMVVLSRRSSQRRLRSVELLSNPGPNLIINLFFYHQSNTASDFYGEISELCGHNWIFRQQAECWHFPRRRFCIFFLNQLWIDVICQAHSNNLNKEFGLMDMTARVFLNWMSILPKQNLHFSTTHKSRSVNNFLKSNYSFNSEIEAWP